MLKKLVSLVLITLIFTPLLAQDTLPRFTIVDRDNKVTISWINPFEKIVQLNVQRSFDSSKYFSTIYSAPSPQLPQNGFTERKYPTNKIYYRIFYVLEGGAYYFTESRRVGAPANFASSRDVKNTSLANIDPADNRIVVIKIKDSVFASIPAFKFQQFRDSILKQTKDTLIAVNDQLVLLSPFVLKEMWRASHYVFANKDGYINIYLPDITTRKYSIKFYEENGTPLFDIPFIRESPLILDKAGFIHAGWFLFELYENDKLKEKNKFYLPKDF